MKFPWSHSKKQEKNNDHYSEYTDDQLLDQFRSENWSSLNEQQKVGVLQEYENRNAAAQGRPPAKVVSEVQERAYGSYNDSSNTIFINVEDFSSYETLDTLEHEGNHAYQTHCIKNGSGYDDHSLSMMAAEGARDSSGHLYNYDTGTITNDLQNIELDSNNHAASVLISESERFKDDPAYAEYISERNTHFQIVNHNLEHSADVRDAMQKNQAWESFARGDLSPEQYQTVTQNFHDPDHTDPAVEESRRIGEELEALDHELSSEQSSEQSSEFSSDLSSDPSIDEDHGWESDLLFEDSMDTSMPQESESYEDLDLSSEQSSDLSSEQNSDLSSDLSSEQNSELSNEQSSDLNSDPSVDEDQEWESDLLCEDNMDNSMPEESESYEDLDLSSEQSSDLSSEQSSDLSSSGQESSGNESCPDSAEEESQSSDESLSM